MKSRNSLLNVTLILAIIGLAIYIWIKSRPSVLTVAEAIPGTSNPASSVSAPAIGQSTPGLQGSPSGVLPKMSKMELIETYMSWLNTSISFYGKVIDDKGDPVPGANITYQVGDKIDPNADGSKYSGASDKNGDFSLTGRHGVDLYVNVSKDGYYRTPRSMDTAVLMMDFNMPAPRPVLVRLHPLLAIQQFLYCGNGEMGFL